MAPSQNVNTVKSKSSHQLIFYFIGDEGKVKPIRAVAVIVKGGGDGGIVIVAVLFRRAHHHQLPIL